MIQGILYTSFTAARVNTPIEERGFRGVSTSEDKVTHVIDYWVTLVVSKGRGISIHYGPPIVPEIREY